MQRLSQSGHTSRGFRCGTRRGNSVQVVFPAVTYSIRASCSTKAPLCLTPVVQVWRDFSQAFHSYSQFRSPQTHKRARSDLLISRQDKYLWWFAGNGEVSREPDHPESARLPTFSIAGQPTVVPACRSRVLDQRLGGFCNNRPNYEGPVYFSVCNPLLAHPSNCRSYNR